MSNKPSDSLNTIVYRKDKHITPDEYLYDFKMEYITKFRKAHLEEPMIKKRPLCKKIGLSESTLNRFMKDLNMKSFYTNRKGKRHIGCKPINTSIGQDQRLKLREESNVIKNKTSQTGTLHAKTSKAIKQTGGYVKDSNGNNIRPPIINYRKDNTNENVEEYVKRMNKELSSSASVKFRPVNL